MKRYTDRFRGTGYVEGETGKEVTTMEGIILDAVATLSPGSWMAAMALLALAVAFLLFGYMEEEEKSGRRLYWAEWPLPESPASPAEEEELRLAA